MLEMIRDRRTSHEKEERYDLLSSLLDANEGDASHLSESELMGKYPWHQLGWSHLRYLSRKHIYILPCRTRGECSLGASRTNRC